MAGPIMIKRSKNLCGECIEYFNELHQRHRLDGPALEYISGSWKGYRIWQINGLYHREDGPAIIYSDGNYEYHYNEKVYWNIKSDEEWKKFLKCRILWE